MEANKNPKGPGRQTRLDHPRIHAVLSEYKDKIIINECDIVGSSHPIWQDITAAIADPNWTAKQGKGKNAYSYLCNNMKGIRELLCPNWITSSNSETLNNNVMDSLMLNSTLDSSYDYDAELVFRMDANTFQLLIEQESVRCTQKRKKMVRTEWKINVDEFKKFIDRNLEAETRRSCAYTFKCRSYIHTSSEGRLEGKCICGSIMNCFLAKDGEIMVIRCEITDKRSKETCGKRNKKYPVHTINKTQRKRKIHTSPSQFDAENVEEEALGNNVHKGPIRFMETLKATTKKNEIRNIRRNPVQVSYLTPYQRTVYKSLIKNSEAEIVILIDDTVIKPIQRVDVQTAKELNYFQVVAVSRTGETAVNQLISENTDSYLFFDWMIQWIEGLKLPPPPKIILQGMGDLINGCIQAFTASKSLNDYLQCFSPDNDLPSCLIRIDKLTILQKYTQLLLNEKRDITMFYIEGLAKLMQCKTLNDAEIISRALFTISSSLNKGVCTDGTKSSCDLMTVVLNRYPCTSLSHFGINKESFFQISEKDRIFTSKLTSNLISNSVFWKKWSLELKTEALNDIAECPGSYASRWYMPHFAQELEGDLAYFPLWTSIYENPEREETVDQITQKAQREVEKLKSILTKKYALPTRLDNFIEIHLDYLDGKFDGLRQDDDVSSSSEVEEQGRDHNVDRRSECTECSSKGETCNWCHQDLERSKTACVVCDLLVHAGSPCSVPIPSPEESYGTERVCRLCSAKPTVHKMLNSHDFENWKNENVLHMKKARVKRNRRVRPPILLQGNSRKLRTRSLNGIQTSMSLTCSFDSISQLFLSAAFVFDSFKRGLEKVQNNLFLKFIQDTSQWGVTDLTFHQRFKLLEGLYSDRRIFQSSGRNISIACDASLIEITEDLLYNYPSFITNPTCLNGCPMEGSTSVILKVPLSSIVSGSAEWAAVEKTYFPSSAKQCTNTETCSSVCSYQIPFDYLLIETFDAAYHTVQLDDIPQILELPSLEPACVLHLAGLIHFDPPYDVELSREKNEPGIGHYSAYCIINGAWKHYDTKVSDCFVTEKVLPNLILYIKESATP